MVVIEAMDLFMYEYTTNETKFWPASASPFISL